MSLVKLLKIHFIYLFSKRNILLLSIFTIIISFVNGFVIFRSKSLTGNPLQIVLITWETVFTFNKLLLVLIGSYLMNNFCLPHNDEYRILFLIDVKRKEIYFIAKILVLLLVLTVLSLLIFLIFILSFLIINLDFKIELTYFKGFLLIYLQLITYGLISSILAILVKSTLSSILSFIIYLIIDLMNYEVSILNTFFPLILFEKYEIFFGKYLLNLLVISIFYFVIYTLINRGKNS